MTFEMINRLQISSNGPNSLAFLSLVLGNGVHSNEFTRDDWAGNSSFIPLQLSLLKLLIDHHQDFECIPDNHVVNVAMLWHSYHSTCKVGFARFLSIHQI